MEHGRPSRRIREELVLRLYSGEGAGVKSAHEFQSIKHLREVGYPVPQVTVLEREQSPFGKPFVIREYESFSGETVDAIDCFIVFACVRRLFDVAVSLLQGAEKMGMRAEAAVAMRKNMAAHERVYWLLVERTGLRIKEVDEMLLSRLPLGQ